MPLSKISITIEASVLAELDRRREHDEAKDRSRLISRDLARYYEALRFARQSLRDRLSSGEISAILDNLNGCWMFEATSIRLLWANVSDGISLDGLDQKWEIDGAALVEKLKALSFAESCALADAAERWWRRVGQGEQDISPAEALRD